MRRVLFVAAAVTALSCTPKNPSSIPTPANPPGAPPPAPPPAAPPQALRLGPSALRYVMHQVIHVDQQLPDRQLRVDYGLRIFFAVTISGPADSIGYRTTITIDSITPDSGATPPPGVNLGVAKALSFAGWLTATGEFRNPVASDTMVAQALSPVVGSFKSFFPRLPASGVAINASWTDTVTTSDRSAGNVTLTSINRSHAAAWEDRNGTRTVRVEVTSTFTIKGNGEQFGQPFEVAGTGVRSGVDYVAVDGRYMGGESHDSTTMTITLPIQTMTIPRTQVSKTTVTVLP